MPRKATADLRNRQLVRLGPVDANGDVSVGGAQLLVEAAVGADPQVVLCDFHLGKTAAEERKSATKGNRPVIASDRSTIRPLTAHRKPEPGMESNPSSSLVMEIM